MTKPASITLCGLVIAAATFLVDRPDAQAGFCYGCGSNAATLGDNVQFEELNLNGLLRGEGPKIKFRGAYLNGSRTSLRVDDHLLTALTGGSYSGTAIKDLTIDLTVEKGGSYQIRLFVFKVDCTANDRECAGLWYWAAPHTLVPHYIFRVRKVGGFPQNLEKTIVKPWTGKEDFLCRAERDQNTGLVGDYQHSAIIFIGDQYNAKKRTVEDSEADWFNVACSGTAIYKMHMLRHTKAGKTTGKSTTIDQRTAMLKAISADYCGDGRAWTGDGTPLDWTDAQKFYPDPPVPDVIERAADVEAIWSKNGALCLNTPRRLPKVPNPSWGDGSNCSDPAVRRTEVVSSCAWAGIAPTPMKVVPKALKRRGPPPKLREFLPVPRFPLTGLPLKGHLPQCDQKWLDTWNDPAARDAAGAYAVTLNVTKDANYCDPSP